jgi:hypothetical protein
VGITTSTRLSVVISDTSTSGYFNGSTVPVVRTISSSYGTSGTNADQSDLVGTYLTSFTASNAVTVNFQTAFVDAFGATITPVEMTKLTAEVTFTNATNGTLTAAINGTNGLTSIGGFPTLGCNSASNPAFFHIERPDGTGYQINGTIKNVVFTPSAHAGTLRLTGTFRSA